MKLKDKMQIYSNIRAFKIQQNVSPLNWKEHREKKFQNKITFK